MAREEGSQGTLSDVVDRAEALHYAAQAVAATLDMLQADYIHRRQGEVYHMLAQVLRNPEIMI